MADGRGWREWDGRAGGAGSATPLPRAPGDGMEWDGMEEAGGEGCRHRVAIRCEHLPARPYRRVGRCLPRALHSLLLSIPLADRAAEPHAPGGDRDGTLHGCGAAPGRGASGRCGPCTAIWDRAAAAAARRHAGRGHGAASAVQRGPAPARPGHAGARAPARREGPAAAATCTAHSGIAAGRGGAAWGQCL